MTYLITLVLQLAGEHILKQYYYYTELNTHLKTHLCKPPDTPAEPFTRLGDQGM